MLIVDLAVFAGVLSALVLAMILKPAILQTVNIQLLAIVLGGTTAGEMVLARSIHAS